MTFQHRMAALISEPKPGAPALIERLFALNALLLPAVGMGLLAWAPLEATVGPGHAVAAAATHLITLGGVLGGYYVLQPAIFARLYRRPPAGLFLGPVIWASQAAGVALLAWGFLRGAPLIAYVGGHYLVPVGIVLAFFQGVVTALRRPAGTPLHPAAHLPGLGLLVTMSLGALLVMDAFGLGYGIYTPQTILVHALAGGFLFFLPLVLLDDCTESAPAMGAAGPEDARSFSPSPTATMLLPILTASLGVLAVAAAGPAAIYPTALASGLALLGAVALWLSFPAARPGRAWSFRLSRRMPWGAVGILLLFAAIRAWRGIEAEEALRLGSVTAAVFLFAVALPEIVARLGERSDNRTVHSTDQAAPAAVSMGDGAAEILSPEPGPALVYGAQLLAAGLLVAPLLGGEPWLGRAGALLWLVTLLWALWRLLRRRRN
ncbi:MAG: hypothetical protein IIA14_08665 [SAR324 cluster bacterium]|nr:hypothetical protein [SAR324 cluster bacterium]